MKAHNVTIIFGVKNLSTASTDTELIISILSAYAEAENDNRHQNQYWSIVKRLKNGSSTLYNRSCYGYIKNDFGELVISPKEAAVVRDIFQLYLSGFSIIGIQKELERRGVPSPSGKEKWCKRSLDTMLSNENIWGTPLYSKHTQRKTCESITLIIATRSTLSQIITRQLFRLKCSMPYRKKRNGEAM